MKNEYQCGVCGCALSFEGENNLPEFDSCETLETETKAGHVCGECHRIMPCYEKCQ